MDTATRDRNIATWLGDAPQPVRDTTNPLPFAGLLVLATVVDRHAEAENGSAARSAAKLRVAS